MRGLVDWWPLHEASGSGYGRATGITMSDENSVGSAAGKVVLARDFNGSNQRLVHASDANVQTGDVSFTWVCWAYFDNISSNRGIIVKDSTSGTGREYILQLASGVPRFAVFRSGPSAQQVDHSGGSVSTGTWYFMAGWHDAAGDVVGIQVDLTRTTAATSGALQGAGAADLHFGSFSDNSLHMDGRICEAGFWRRVLTISELHWLYNQGMGRTYPLDGRPSPVMMPAHGRRHRMVGQVA